MTGHSGRPSIEYNLEDILKPADQDEPNDRGGSDGAPCGEVQIRRSRLESVIPVKLQISRALAAPSRPLMTAMASNSSVLKVGTGGFSNSHDRLARRSSVATAACR